MRWIVLVGAWVLRAAGALVLTVAIVNAGLVLALFGPGEGAARLLRDWRTIFIAHELEDGRLSPEAAFAKVYGKKLGASPPPEAIRALVAQDLERGEPAVFDVILARYILARFGAIDGRTVPSGVYLAAGPIGPDAWPAPLVTQYLVFPRHGYLLVVPPRRGGNWPQAYEATASLRKEFRRSGDADALYGVVQPYKTGAYDFPTAGEPLHDLVLLSDAPREIEQIEERLTSLSRTMKEQGLTYRLLRRNSNSALACYLQETQLTENVGMTINPRLLLRLRLPGIVGATRPKC